LMKEATICWESNEKDQSLKWTELGHQSRSFGDRMCLRFPKEPWRFGIVELSWRLRLTIVTYIDRLKTVTMRFMTLREVVKNEVWWYLIWTDIDRKKHPKPKIKIQSCFEMLSWITKINIDTKRCRLGLKNSELYIIMLQIYERRSRLVWMISPLNSRKQEDSWESQD
jgi:hypothetical protein